MAARSEPRGRRTARALAAALGAWAIALAAGPGQARPLVLEDLLQKEGFGRIVLTPDGRRLVVEQRGPFASAARFDFGRFNALFRTRLMVADLAAGGPLRPMVPPEPGAGYQLGPISPDGARAAVFRLTADSWRLGIATLATGEVRWLDLTPDLQEETRTLQWASPTRLLAIALAPGELPFDLKAVRPQGALPALWAAAARGEAAVTAVGSGRYRGLRPQAPPKRLVSIDAPTGAVTRLADGDFVDLELAPSGRRLALTEAAEDIALTAGRPVQGRYGIAVRRMRLVLLDLNTATLRRPCPTCDLLTSLLAWSPKGDELLAYVRCDGAAWDEGHLIRVRGSDGGLRRAEQGLAAAVRGRPERVFAGWWDGEPLLYGRRPGDRRDDWYALRRTGPVRLTGELGAVPTGPLVVARHALLMAADGFAWRIDRRGHARQLSPHTFTPIARRSEGVPDRTAFVVREGQTLAGLLSALPDREAVRLDAAGHPTPLAPVADGETLLGASLSGAVVDEVFGGGAETLVWRGPGLTEKVLARINARLAGVDRPTPIAIRHTGPGGEALTSWLYLPPAPPGGPPPPLVVVPYPGATYRAPPKLQDEPPMAPAPVLLGHGYAVLVPSLPRPPGGRGPAEGLADQVLAIVAAAARQGDLAGRFDPARLGLWGHSFGGYGTLAILTETGRFRAAVATAAPSDLVSFWGQFEPSRRIYPQEGLSTPWTAGWTETLQGDMGAPPWAAPERYRENSPLMQAGRITTPLLIAAGEIDAGHLGQAEELFSALYRQDKDAVLLTYWGEPHLTGSPGNLRDLYGRALAFLDAHLKGPSTAAGSDPRRLRPEPGSASSGPRTPRPPPR